MASKMESQAASAADVKLNLKVVSTHKTGIEGYSRLAVMESTGRVVVCGPSKFYVYRITSTGLELDKEIEPLFDKGTELQLLPIMHRGQEVLLISCPEVGEIKMLNVETGQHETVFKDPNIKLDLMCAGEEGRIYVTHGKPVSRAPVKKVLELDTASVPFTVAGTVGVRFWLIHSLGYIPTYKYLVGSNYSKHMVRAFSSESGSEVWGVPVEIKAQLFSPRCMVYDSKRDVLIVYNNNECARDSERFLTFEASSGTGIQTIPYPEGVHNVSGMAWYKDQIVALHKSPDGGKSVSFLSLH